MNAHRLFAIGIAAALLVSPLPALAQNAPGAAKPGAAKPAAVAPTAAAPAASAASAAAAPALSSEQIETFLLNAKIVSSRKIGKGVTGSLVATMTDGRVTHDAHIQHVNIHRIEDHNFKDHYRYNIAAYRLARLLGLANVPVSVERIVDEMPAAVTWWVDGVLMDEEKRLEREKEKTAPAWPRVRIVGYQQVMRVFDELIANADRNMGNQLWTNDGTLWMIDHTRAFRPQRALKKASRLERCDRALWKAMQELTIESLTAAAERTLTKDEIKAVMARRDLILDRFTKMIDSRGEPAVLFNLTP
jgi:hypothetical protein